MRIIAGELGGRSFAAPHGHRTHPMSDKIRGALFNMLGDISGQTVLDAFSGSGALTFEALSRGAAHAIAIDNDKNAQRAIVENSAALGLQDRCKVIKAQAGAWLRTTNGQYDLVLLDPPYDKVQLQLITELAACVKPGGTLVLSWPPKERLPELPGLSEWRHKNYGDADLYLFLAK